MNRNKTIGALLIAATFMSTVTPFVAATPIIPLKDINTVGHKGDRHNIAPVGPIGPIRNVDPESFFRPGYDPIVKENNQKVLLLMLNMDNDPFRSEHNEQYYYDCLFGSATDSVKNFVINQSGGRVKIQPADTKNSPLKGVIKMDVKASDYGTVGSEDFEKHQQIMKDSLNKIKDEVDWAAMDINNDKKFEQAFFLDEAGKKEEVVVMAVISGATKVGDYKEEGKIKSWPHTSYFEYTLGDYQFKNNMIMASEFAEADILSQTTLSHEYLHNLNARDMYLDEDSIGPWSTMCTTYGQRPGENRTSPVPLDPVHKMYMGWSAPKEIKISREDVEIPYKKDEVPYIQDPKNPDVYYLLDYRDFSDENQKALHGFNVRNDGILVWKINKTEAERDWYFAQNNELPDWYVNSKGARTAMSVLVKGAGPTSYENSYINVGSGCRVQEGLEIEVHDKKMILKGSPTAPEPTPAETLTIEVADKTVEIGQKVNPLEGVVVKNSKGEVVQAKLDLVASNLKENEPGDYSVTVRATFNGATVEKSYKITVVAKPEAKEPPTITASDRTINKGADFNPKEGVTAKDSEGNDLTSEINVVDNGVKVDIAGVYQVTFEVTDKNGLKATKTITVTVKDATQPKPEPNPDPEPQPNPKPEPEPNPDPNPKPDPTPNPEPQPEPQPNPKPNPEPTPNPDPTPEPQPTPDKKPISPGVSKDSTPPVIKGVSDAVIKVGDKFDILDGITAVDSDGTESKVQIMPNNFDSAKPGKYTVVYYSFDKAGNMACHERLIEVSGNAITEDKVAPELKLFDTSFSLPKGHKINPLSFVTASDNVDGDISNKVKIVGEVPDLSVHGNYTVKVSVTDKAGNSKDAEMKFNIRDGKVSIFAPTITIHEGDKFDTKTGVTAISSTGIDLTDKVTCDASKLDSAKPGVYTISYSVKDVDGREITVDRKVNVVDKNKEIKMPSVKFTSNVIKKGDKFDEMTGVTSNDKVKVISGKVDSSTTGIYHIVYEVSNDEGNVIQVVRRVVVLPDGIDASAPYIFAFNSRVTVGDKFDPKENVLVVDKEDGILNHKLLVERNDVDTSKVGRYAVKYSVIDNDANATSYTANVEVIEASANPDDLNGNSDDSSGNSANPDNTNGNSANPDKINPADIPKHVMGNLPKTGSVVVANCTATIGAISTVVIKFIRKFKR